MRRVFVVNEPLKLSRVGEWGRAIDLRPAQSFGELVFLAPPGEPPLDPAAWLPRMRELLFTFTPDDYLLPVGHPSLIVAAAAILGGLASLRVVGKTGAAVWPGMDEVLVEISVLVWRGREAGYAPITLPLFPTKENHRILATPQSPENV